MARKPNPNAINFSRKQLGKKRHVYTAQEIARLKSHALQLWKSDNSQAMELGNALLALRKALRGQHGAFKEWWERNRLVQARVSYCMDLASGKLGNRRKKSKSTEVVLAARATQSISTKLRKLFKTCARPHDALYSSGIAEQLQGAIGATLAVTAKLAGWPTNEPAVKQATEAVDKAIAALISTLSGQSAAVSVTESLTKAASAK